ncbi:MAG: hypothetical protein HY331_13790 [Chloroflexi bacterium]|nr:hypothetical protein [Chloroflexota bacterium]
MTTRPSIDQAALDLAGRHQADHLGRRRALPGQLVDRNAPDVGRRLPLLGDVDVAVAGELVRLLADLPASLAVALAGQHRRAAAGPADLATGERQIDAGQTRVDAAAALLDAAGVEGEGWRRPPVEASRRDDPLGRNARDPLGDLRGVRRDGRPDRLPARRVLAHVRVVDQPVLDDLPEHRVQHGDVRPRPDRQPEIGGARRRRLPQAARRDVDEDDQDAAGEQRHRHRGFGRRDACAPGRSFGHSRHPVTLDFRARDW